MSMMNDNVTTWLVTTLLSYLFDCITLLFPWQNFENKYYFVYKIKLWLCIELLFSNWGTKELTSISDYNKICEIELWPGIHISIHRYFVIYYVYYIWLLYNYVSGHILGTKKSRLLGLLTISDHIKSTVIIIICFALTIRCLYTNYIYTWFEIFSQYFTWKNSKFIILIAKFHFT